MIRTAHLFYFGQYMTNDKKIKISPFIKFWATCNNNTGNILKFVKVTVTMVRSSDIFQDKDDN